MNNVQKKVKTIFHTIVSKKKISDKAFLNLKMNDLKEWDSMRNMHFLLEIEKKFNFKFTFKEMSELTSIKKILKSIENVS